MSEAPLLTLIHTGRQVHEVRLGGKLVPMSPLEKQLLGLLARYPEVLVLRADILEVLRVGPAVLKTTVCRLRKKLPQPSYIQSARSRTQNDLGFAYSLATCRIEWIEARRLRWDDAQELITGRLPRPIGADRPLC